MTQTLSEIVEQTAAWPENKAVPVKYCEDCKHYLGTRDARFATCLVPKKSDAALALVTRTPPRGDPRTCRVEREYGDDDSCGPDAKWFEAKASSSVAA